MYKIFIISALIILISGNCHQDNDKNAGEPGVVPVEIRENGGKFQLLRGGEPYFIKGARTLRTRYMDKVAEYGGNSVRIGYNEDAGRILDEAQKLGLTVLFGLPVKAERDGFNYGDAQAVMDQKNKMKGIVQAYKDHPALLAWAIGNELDHIPGDLDYNLSMWDAVNDIARMIHETDPNHPAMTVVGRGKNEKMRDIVERCKDMDLLGVNTYADIGEIPGWLREYGWNKPYAVTEWGPSGHWQVPRTSWGAVIEETSSEKAEVYRKRYEQVIMSDPWCVGSFVFLWTSNRQERTHTWYNMFHDDGSEKEAVAVMQYEWTGLWPENMAPRIDSLRIDGLEARDNIILESGSRHEAEVYTNDPDGDRLTIEWEMVPENKKFGAYAGQGETKPVPVEGVVTRSGKNGKLIEFVVPPEKGSTMRLFVYVHDGKNHVGVANIPFIVGED